MVDRPTTRVTDRICDGCFDTFTETRLERAIRKELTTLVIADGTPFSRQLGDKTPNNS